MSDHDQPRGHRLLKWMGLQQPPPDPEAWMPVVSDLHPDDPETGLCERADELVDALTAAGIEAHQRAYARADQGRSSGMSWGALFGGVPAVDRVRIAVVVHNRDLEPALRIAARIG